MIVHNPTSSNIRDYPIQDPTTKEVKLWSIDSGETLEFPEFVGKYLLEVYAFLQRVVTEEQVKKEQEEKKKIDAGMHFSQVKVVKATPVQTQPIEKGAGYTNKLVKTPAGQPMPKTQIPVESPQSPPPPATPPISGNQARVVPSVEVVGEQGIACAEGNCKERFKTMEEMKSHYGVKHLEFDLPTAT